MADCIHGSSSGESEDAAFSSDIDSESDDDANWPGRLTAAVTTTQFARCEGVRVPSIQMPTITALEAGRVRRYTFAATAVLLMLVAVAQVQARCPIRRRGQYSNCAYTKCSPSECAAKGLECCPKPCGGSWCVKGVGPRRSRRAPFRCPTFVPPPDGCEGPRNNATCFQLGCKSKASICCYGPCGSPFCLKV
ncbi:uncharacterized protein LOC142583699 [Dermacentor variabilis]|uniref:uncharacterized protein LOC142583699 n=1 Tax=Dermacentor variabilis TaxID=34621 RepID=UPI003F5BE752